MSLESATLSTAVASGVGVGRFRKSVATPLWSPAACTNSRWHLQTPHATEAKWEALSERPGIAVAVGMGGLVSLRKRLFASRRGSGMRIVGALRRQNEILTVPGMGDLTIPRNTVNEAGFDIGVTMTPEQAEALGIKPFGDGGADDTPSPRLKVYTHGPCASPLASQFIVKCGNWRNTAPGDNERNDILESAMSILKKEGFVVLEHLMPADWVAPLEAEAAEYLDQKHEGLQMQPLRAKRQQLHLPFTMPWASDWLVKHELILQMVAKYVQNNLAGGRNQEEQQMGLVNWLMGGADLEWFRSEEAQPKGGKLWESPARGCSIVGSADKVGPWLGRVMVTKTPPASPSQKHHRDINFPGPTAQLTIQVALTPLVANNGPLGYVPGSHRMESPGYEIVANPPLGSVVLYDSFCEHHGIENTTSQDRYAMYYEFETRGIFGGYTDDHFGPKAESETVAFRMAVDPDLRSWVDQV